jgi:hypothetical protein
MTLYSKTELATHSMRKTGLLGAEETLSSSDLEFASKIIDSRVAYLASVGVSIPNGSAEAVPMEWLDPLADYIGLYLLSAYGGSAPTDQQVMGAMRPLRQLASSAKPATGLVAESAYY